jgi:hypothetical protein
MGEKFAANPVTGTGSFSRREKFLHPAAIGGEQILTFTIGKERLPFFVQDRNIVIEKIELFAKCTQASTYNAILSYVNQDGDTVTSTQISLPQNSTYGGLNSATLNATDAESVSRARYRQAVSVKLKRAGGHGLHSTQTNPDEVQDIRGHSLQPVNNDSLLLLTTPRCARLRKTPRLWTTSALCNPSPRLALDCLNCRHLLRINVGSSRDLAFWHL